MLEGSFLYAVNPTYCNGSGPIVANANVPEPYRTIGSRTDFTCLPGYQASTAPTPLYYTCDDYLQASGKFSSASGTCGSISFVPSQFSRM